MSLGGTAIADRFCLPQLSVFSSMQILTKVRPVLFLILCAALLFLPGCSGPAPYTYRYIPGKTAVQQGAYAIVPPEAPEEVHAAIAAGNRIVGSAYCRGGGHGNDGSGGFDCSGAASFVLQGAGLLRGSMPSTAFRSYGQRGPGDWISVYARRGHVFLVVAGLRFDTGWTGGPEGPQWTTKSRPAKGCVIRHPSGL